MLLRTQQVKKMISSYVGENKEFERQYPLRRAGAGVQPAGHAGRALRAGGAGIPGFYTKTGVGTIIAEGKEHRDFNGETYILETGLVADLSIVKAEKADTQGNLVFNKTARNFNLPAARRWPARSPSLEVEEIVPTGEPRSRLHPPARGLRPAHDR